MIDNIESNRFTSEYTTYADPAAEVVVARLERESEVEVNVFFFFAMSNAPSFLVLDGFF